MIVNPIKAPYLQGGRELCVTGSCVLTASDDLLGNAIRLFEGHSWCSHAAPVVRMPAELMSAERVTLLEALEHGLTPTYLSHYFTGFKGRLFLFTPKGISPDVQVRFSAWLLDKTFAQTKYDYVALGRQVAGHVQEDDASLFCSEAWGMAAEFAGLSRAPDAPQGVAPQPPDIATWWPGDLVELVGPFTTN